MKTMLRCSAVARVGAIMGFTTCLAGLGFVVQPVRAAENEKPAAAEGSTDESEPGDYRNWINLSVGGISTGGDQFQFQQRHRMIGDIFGGIEDLHWERDIGKALLTIDGRAIFDTQDYLLKFELSQEDLGFIRAGVQTFRTWYDGSGGFVANPRLAGGGFWPMIYNENLYLDRGEFWIEAGLRIPDFPEITLSYMHQYRDGQKDSTIWGDSALTGVAGATGARGVVPTFLNIKEKRDILTLDIKDTFGITDVGIGLRYEWMDNDDSTNIRRRPGEATDRFVTEREIMTADVFDVYFSTETRYHEKLWLTTGYTFTSMNTDVGGSRIYGATYDAVYDPLFARRQQRDEGFLNLGGGSEIDQHVANLNVMWQPMDTLSIVSAFRYENHRRHNISTLLETNFGGGAARPAIIEELEVDSARSWWNTAESIELRYTGISDVLFYARGEWSQECGSLSENEFEGAMRNRVIFLDTDNTRTGQKYTAGFNWYPCREANIAFQYYHKIRENSYDSILDSTNNRPPSGNRYPEFLRQHDFITDDLNVRLTLHPISNVTMVSRYDYQNSTIDTQGDFLAAVESADFTSHIFSQSITWTPLSRLYLQGNIHHVYDQTNTPAANITPTVQNAENTYWNADVTLGLALDNKTSLQASYYYYRADNYFNNFMFSQPYGAGAEEHAASVTLSRQIAKNIRWNLRYGFFSGRDETSGGRNNYTANLVYTNFQIRF